MPELPEVQTTVDGLQLILKQYIKNIKINTNRLRYLIPKNIKKILNNQKIIKIHRIAKYIALDLSNNTTLIIHLGMSGRIKILKILLPTTLLTERASEPLSTELTLTNNSGALVPRETTVKPITN